MCACVSRDICRKKHPISLIFAVYISELLGIICLHGCMINLVDSFGKYWKKNCVIIYFLWEIWRFKNFIILNEILEINRKWHICITDINITLCVLNFLYARFKLSKTVLSILVLAIRIFLYTFWWKIMRLFYVYKIP